MSSFLNNLKIQLIQKIHKATTAIEIFTDLEGDIQAFVSGVGTGGTITGVGEYLKSKLEKVEIIAVEPFESQVLAGGTHSSHKIQGIGAGFIPEVMNLKVVDRIIPITSEEAIQMTKLVAKTEGVLVGISSGAALAAAVPKKITIKTKILLLYYLIVEKDIFLQGYLANYVF